MADEVIDIDKNHISLIFGHSKALYSDNSLHFFNQKVPDHFQEQGVTHFTWRVSHPSLTGLLERTVQLMMSYIRDRYIKRGSTEALSIDIREGVIFANIKSQKIHGYAPAELVLRFSSQMKHFDVEGKKPIEADLEIKDTTEHQNHMYMALWDESLYLASEASAYSLYRREQRKRRQKIPKVGDLVLVRNHALDRQRGRKLESKWLGPRLLVLLSLLGPTKRVKEIFGEGGIKKYHLNDLILYVERKDFKVSGVKVFQQDMGTTPAVIRGHERGETEARALILRSR